MSNKVEVRDDDGTGFNIIFPEFTKELFADGYAQTLVGKTNSKVSFFTSDGPNEEDIEERKVIFRVCMPTSAWLDLANSILERLTPVVEAENSSKKSD